jgi:carbon starvation protein
MFEALFILTTLDAGTRVGRYILQDALQRVAPKMAGTGWGPNVITSTVFVAAWGYFVIAGVIDPHGGIRALWPLFGIANQLLAATALTIATTILLRTGKKRYVWVTGIPLVWLLSVTMTAGLEYVFHPDPRIGFLAKANAMVSGALPVDAATKGIQVFNARLDAFLALVFLVLVATVVLSALRQWRRILSGQVALEPDPPAPWTGGAAAPAWGDVPRSAGGPRCC